MEGNKNITNNNETKESLDILSKSLQDSMRKLAENEGYVTYNIEARSFNTGGGNVMSQCFEVDIKGETEEGAKEMNIFIKQAVIFHKTKFLSVDEAFSKEAFVYKDLLKVIASLQEQAGVPQHDRYKMPKAYDQTNTEAIILDNLNKRNFKIYNRLIVMPLKYVQLGVQELAKFHALSFVIENKMPEYFNEKIKPLRHTFRYDEEWKQLVRNVCESLGNIYDDNIKRKLENFLPNFLEKFPKYNDDDTNIKRCLTHVDYRTANVLVREHNGEPVEVMPLDYQLIDYGCPIRDFLYFVFSGTDREFRKQHLNDLKDIYFNTMARFMKYFDMDVETVYPRDEFEKIYTEWLDHGLMIVLIFSPFLYASETGVDLKNLRLSEVRCDFNQHAQERLKGLIEEFIQWGYL